MAGRPAKYPWADMKEGDELIFPLADASRIRASLSQWSKKANARVRAVTNDETKTIKVIYYGSRV